VEEKKELEIDESEVEQDIPTEEGDSLDTIIIDHHFELQKDDLLVIADRMVELDDQQESQESQKKAVMQEWTGLIKATEAERRQLAQVYRSGKDVRSVECYAVPDYGSGLMLFVSVCGWDLIKERDLDNSEKQMDITEIVSETPRCHMKDMQLDESDPDLPVWTCVVCGSTKPYEEVIE